MNWEATIAIVSIIFIGAYWWESNESTNNESKLTIAKAALIRTAALLLFIAIFGGIIHFLEGDRSNRPSCGGNRYVGNDACYDNY